MFVCFEPLGLHPVGLVKYRKNSPTTANPFLCRRAQRRAKQLPFCPGSERKAILGFRQHPPSTEMSPIRSCLLKVPPSSRAELENGPKRHRSLWVPHHVQTTAQNCEYQLNYITFQPWHLLVLIPIHYLVRPSIDRCHIYYFLCFPLSPRAGRVITAQIWIWSWMCFSQSHCNVSGSVLHPRVLKSLTSRAAAWPMHHCPSCDRLGGGYFVKCG